MKKQIRTGFSLLLAFSMCLSPMADFGGSSVKATASAATEAKGESNTNTNTENTGENNTGTDNPDTAGDNSGEDTSYTDASTGYTFTTYETDNITMAKITGCTDASRSELSFPASVKKTAQDTTSIPVGSIGDTAFSENQTITSVTIPEGVEIIGFRAFYGCGNITSVSIPSTIQEWTVKEPSVNAGYSVNSAFENCTSLTSLTLADKLEIIGGSSFSGCTALETLRLPSHLNKFLDNAFKNCTKLKNLTMPEGMEEFGYHVFMGCTSLTEIQIPSTIKRYRTVRLSTGIMQSQHDCAAFQDCSSLKKVTFTEGLTTLHTSNLFQGECTSLKSVTIPSSVTDMYRAFRQCKYLENIILSEGLKKIGAYAFEQCTSLKKMDIPSSVTEIEERAFYECDQITSLILPENITLFSGNSEPIFKCKNLKTIYLLAENIEYFKPIKPNDDFVLYCLKGTQTWDIYYEVMKDSPNLSGMPEIEGITATPYQGIYDGKEHPLFSIEGMKDGDVWNCQKVSEESGEVLTQIPQITEPGSYEYTIMVKRKEPDSVPPVKQSVINITAEIQKKTTALVLEDMTFSANTDYQIVPKEYQGESTVTYRYYKDEKCQKRMSSKPVNPGTYYVIGVSAESEHYLAAKSNAAKLVVTEEVILPSPSPAASDAPDNTSKPGTSPSPGNTSKPGVSPSPGNTSPSPVPSSTPKPTDKASPKPTKKPGKGKSTPTPVRKKVVVKKAALKGVKSKKKKTVQVTWKKLSGVTGYQIKLGQNKKMTKSKKTITVKKAKTTKLTIKKLKSRKKYYIKIRAYRIVNRKKYYGKWSKIKSIKIK